MAKKTNKKVSKKTGKKSSKGSPKKLNMTQAECSKWARNFAKRARDGEIRGVVAIVVTSDGEIQMSQTGSVTPKDIALPLIMMQQNAVESQRRIQRGLSA